MRITKTSLLVALTLTSSLSLLSSSPAHASDIWEGDPTDAYDQDERRFNIILRGGLGSMFGPGFKTGQPEYANANPITMVMRERSPFGAGHQALMTVGTAATAEIATKGSWAYGITGLAGFNATAGRGGDLGNDLSSKQKLQGATLGAGVRARYGDNERGMTLDVTYSMTRLNGSVDWDSEGFWGADREGTARYSYAVQKYNVLLGYERPLTGPLFGFAQAGVQYLPVQRSHLTQSGVVPLTNDDSFEDDIRSRTLPELDEQVEFQAELQYALGAGVGLRF